MEKFEVDTEAKTAELAQLKADKEKDLRALQELARTYDDYEVPTLLLYNAFPVIIATIIGTHTI